MVNLTDVQSSNKQVAVSLPPRSVAVFVGATNGIGELAMKAFVKHAVQPRVYFVGRSQEAGTRIKDECRELNADGEYVFIAADVSLIKKVDEVCSQIKTKETAINLLLQSQGTLDFSSKTSEELPLVAALTLFSRVRFTVNLLPLLQQATGLRRVVSVFAGTKEGAVNTNDLQGRNISLLAMRGHAASLVTLSMEAIAQKAPDVAFVHNFPGSVKSGIGRTLKIKGVASLFITFFRVFEPLLSFVYTPAEEVGERHLFVATSARYAPKTESGGHAGVPLPDGMSVAKGIDGEMASGVYSIDNNGEECAPNVIELLGGLRRQGLPGQIWKHIEGEFERITGQETM